MYSKAKERSDGKHVALQVRFYPTNSGGVFSRNYSSNPVTVELYVESKHDHSIKCPIERADKARDYIVLVVVGRTTYAADADSMGRKYIRDNDLRGRFKELMEESS